MKHYVIIFDYAIDKTYSNGIEICGVTHSLDEAKEILATASADEKEYAKEHGYTIYTDTDMEFDAGEDGYYASEHAHYYIEEVM